MRPWHWLVLWAVIAAVGLTRSLVTSLHPPHGTDLTLVVEWADRWLWSGTSPYTGDWPRSNYPPWALVFLSPLTLVPPPWLPLVWGACSVILASIGGVVAARLAAPRPPGLIVALVTAMFLSWFAIRVGLRAGQFSVVSLVLGLAAVALAGRRPGLGGIALGLSLTKLHVGGAFFLWALLTRRLRMASVAVATMAAGAVVFSARLGESPLGTFSAYLAELVREFGGPAFHPGWVELRPLVHALVPAAPVAEVVHLVLVAGTLVVALVVSARASGTPRERDLRVLGVCCGATLIVTFHNPYDLVLLLPLMSVLGVTCSGLGASDRRPLCGFFALAQLLLVVDVPALAMGLDPSSRAAGLASGLAMLRHFDRLLVVATFVVACRLALAPADRAT